MMIVKPLRFLAMTAAFVLSAAYGAYAQCDAQPDARLFPQCAACHTLEPGRNLTGPSLANLFGRNAWPAAYGRSHAEPQEGQAR